jgi:glutamate racemase
VFDSGIGGLSVLQAIHQLLPAEDLIYVADTAHLPYGDKPPATVRARAAVMADFLASQNAKAMVAACNTATAHAIESLRTGCAIPIIGVEPGVKPAALSSQAGVIGILATTATTESTRFSDLMRRHGQGARFVVQPCPGLAEAIETGNLRSDDLREMIRARVAPLIDAGADTIVLGCTHYSFVAQIIQCIAGPNVNIVDTGMAVARQLARTLAERDLARSNRQGTVTFYTTGEIEDMRETLRKLWGPVATVASLPADCRDA